MSERAKKILILGGAVGGLAAATRLRRLDERFDITIVDRFDDIALSPCGLPYYIAGDVDDRNALFSERPDKIQKRYELKILSGHEAIRIDRSSRQLVTRNLKTRSEVSIPYDKLILSPGAAPIRPHVPGMDLPLVKTVRTPGDAEEILSLLNRSPRSREPVVVMGGGRVGLELIEAFCRRKIPVVLLEAAKQVLIEADIEMVVPLRQELQRRGVQLQFDVSLSKLLQDSEHRIRLVFFDKKEIAARLLVVAAGVRPEVSLALDAGLNVGLTGAIKVNDRMQTNDPDIYAIGDAVQQEVHWPEKTLIGRPIQAGSTCRQARVAADHLIGFRHHAFESFGGTTTVRLFDLTFAGTGFSEKRLRRERIPYEKVYVTMPDHVEYLPGAEPLTLKILFSPVDGKLYGAQVIGKNGVERRIDVLATAIRFGGTVRQLAGIELCYTPPSGWPKDPVHCAGNVAANVLDGLVRHATLKEMKRPKSRQVPLDVRETSEFQEDAVPGAMSIPLEQLRKRRDELDKDKEYLVYSQNGFRGYLACRILSQSGFEVKNFSGGLTVFRRLVPK